MKGRITKTGYRRNSPDVNNDFNIIPSNRISMKGVDFPVFGVDNLGNSQMMYPDNDYEFEGNYVTELPAYGSGGLTQWFAEEWVDVKTGKKCGRSGKDKKGRPYPACRPSKRVNKTTPKTKGEMSAAEKAKFKRSKTSKKRINYNHKRAQFGGRSGDLFQEVDTYIKPGQRIRPNWAQTTDAATNYTFGKNLVDDESRFALGVQGTDILDEIKYRADAIGSVGIGVGNRKGKSFRPSGENLRAGIRGKASWQGLPGNVLENMLGRRSGVDWRGSIEGEAGMAYANGAVRPYMSVTPQTNFNFNDKVSLGVGYEMRGRYDRKKNDPLYGNSDTGTIAPVSQRDAYSGMGRGASRLSLNYDLGNGDFIEGYYSKPDALYQGSIAPFKNVMALESDGPRFGVRLRKSFDKGGALDKYQTKGETPLTRNEIFNIPRSVRYEDGNMVLQDKPIWDGMLDEVTITPTTSSEIAWQENRANQATGGLDPIYPVFELLSMGTGTAYRSGAGALARNTGKKQTMKLADHFIPIHNKGAKAYAKSMKVPPGANMNIADDVWSSGSLYGKGNAFQRQEALERIANFQKDLSPVPFTHAHGTGANALEGIFKNKGLRPSSELQKSGDLLTGEMLRKQSAAPHFFKSGQSTVSTASIGNPRAAAQYALDYGKGAGNYPVVFGINPRVGAQSRMSIPFESTVQGETLFRNGIGFDEISNIFVPDAQKAAFIQKYGDQLGNIKLGSFNDYVNQAKALSGRRKITGAEDYLYQKGGSLPSYQTEGEVPFAEMLDQVDVTVDKNTGENILNNYPYYNQLSTTDRRYFNDSSAIGRGVRRRAKVGDKSLYSEFESGAKNLLNNAAEFSGLAGSARFTEDPAGNLQGAATAFEKFMMGTNPMASTFVNTEITPEESQQFFNTLDIAGAIPGTNMVTKPAKGAIAIQKAARAGTGATRNIIKQVASSPSVRNIPRTLIDPFRLKSLNKKYIGTGAQLKSLDDDLLSTERFYSDLRTKAIDSKNIRSEKFINLRGQNPQVFNRYNDRRRPLLTPFKSRDAFNKRSVSFSERGINNQLLQQVFNNFNADLSTKGLKPKSLHSPLFENLNTRSSLTDLQTGSTKEFMISPPQSGGLGFRFDSNAGRVVPNQYEATTLLSVPAEARNIVKNNISTLESSIPGFKVMGSSKGFADAGFPSFPKDYDGVMTQNAYNKFVKNKYDLINNTGVANAHMVDINDNLLNVDFNVIEQNSKGFAEGRLAEQLYRKADPDDYFRQTEAILNNKQKSIRIPYTPEELLSKTDFTKESIADSFEISSSKAKHINRPDVYLSYGDADKVLDAQKSYAQSMIGSRAYLPPEYAASEFADVVKNKKLLVDMEFAGDINAVSQDPKKMQAALNDFYFSNTTLSRGVESDGLIRNNATARQALTEWNPEAGGASYSGAGLNNTLLGATGHGDIYGQKQFKLNLNNNTPEDLVNEVRKLSLEENLDENQLEAAHEILMKYGLDNTGVQTKGQFLQEIIPVGPDGLKDYYNATGSPFISGNPYAESIYAGSANVFDSSKDLLAMGFKNFNKSGSIPVGKSWMVRSKNVVNNPNFYYEDALRQFNSDEFSKLYHRLNTPTVDGMAQGIDKAIRRSLNQPGDYTDRLFNAMELRGGLSPNQIIERGIKTRKIKGKKEALEIERSNLYDRIDAAEKLQVPLIGAPAGLGVTAGIINYADNQKMRVNEIRNEKKEAIQKGLELGIPDQYLNESYTPFNYNQIKDNENFVKTYEGLIPLEVNGRFFMVPPEYKKEYQEGGEESTPSGQKRDYIEQSRKENPSADVYTKNIKIPAGKAAVAAAEWADEREGDPSSNTGWRDDLTADLINQYIYGNPTTVAPKLVGLQKLRNWNFEKMRPVEYPSVFKYMKIAGNAVAGDLGLTEGNAPPARDSEGDLRVDEEMYAKVMGVPHTSKYISESKYKPSKAEDPDAKYYTIDWDEMIDKDKLIDYAVENKLMKDDSMVVNSLAPFLKEGYMPEEEFKNIDPLQNFTIGIGEDDKGRYLSVYDKYDFNKTFNTVTSPFEIYDRFYLYRQGGENIPVYNTYKTKNRAWLAARKNLGAGKSFMYGGNVYSTSTPKGL